MLRRSLLIPALLASAVTISAQLRPIQNVANPQSPPDAISSISNDLAIIAQSVQIMGERLRLVLEKPAESTLNDKRQKIVTGLQALAAAEQRVITLQTFQVQLTKEMNDARGKLSQVDIDLRPRNIDRSVVFEGTTETEELRESRRQKLGAERTSLQQLITQLQNTWSQNNDDLRDAQALARNLRRIYIPMLEKEMAEP
jgi:hypothetical protein